MNHTPSHDDWYFDGDDGGDENLWRLDPDPDHQVQLFATVHEPRTWRLFIERDVREADQRILYACDGQAIDQPTALSLLALSNDQAKRHPVVAALMDVVDALPSDPSMCR